MLVPVFLFEFSIDESISVVLIGEKFRKVFSTVLLVNENNQLIEVDLSEQLEENHDLLLFFDLDVELVETVQDELRAVFYENLELLLGRGERNGNIFWNEDVRSCW
jgi:hypothetical protein